MALNLPDQLKAKIENLVHRYPVNDAAIIPALHLVRRARIGMSDETMESVASILGVPPIKIRGVVTFYPMFQIREFGKHVIQVCNTLSCSIMGSKHIVEYLEKKLNIKTGQTTPDKKFTLVRAECLASCGTAPVMQIDERYYENLTEAKIDKILAELE